MDSFDAFLFGCLGGFIAEALAVNNVRKSKKVGWPDQMKHWSYWITAVVMTLVGGAASYIYAQDVKLTALLAVQIGVSAPIIFGSATKKSASVS
jgi:hypothetical protein